MFDEEWEHRLHYNCLDDYELDEVAEDLMKENNNDENFDLYEEIKSQPQIRNVLHELINDLSHHDQEIIYQKFWNNKSEAEIGHDLGMRTSTVKRILGEVYDHLREQIVERFYSNNQIVA